MIETLKLSTALRQIKCWEDPFTFSRWGDGEWRAVLRQNKKGGQNCDGHKFFPKMGVDLAAVLIGRPQYMLGMQNFSMRIYGKSIQRFLERNNLTDLRWYTADVFHHGSYLRRHAGHPGRGEYPQGLDCWASTHEEAA